MAVLNPKMGVQPPFGFFVQARVYPILRLRLIVLLIMKMAEIRFQFVLFLLLPRQMVLLLAMPELQQYLEHRQVMRLISSRVQQAQMTHIVLELAVQRLLPRIMLIWRVLQLLHGRHSLLVMQPL